MLGVIVTLQLLMIGGLIVLAYEVADVQKRIKFTEELIDNLRASTNHHSIDVLSTLEDIKERIADVQAVSSQPELSEDSDSFALRIEQIKSELGLQVQIADEHKKATQAVSLHPGVYNIDEQEHTKYQATQEVEYAK